MHCSEGKESWVLRADLIDARKEESRSEKVSK